MLEGIRTDARNLVRLIVVPRLEIASSEVRERVAQGEGAGRDVRELGAGDLRSPTAVPRPIVRELEGAIATVATPALILPSSTMSAQVMLRLLFVVGLIE